MRSRLLFLLSTVGATAATLGGAPRDAHACGGCFHEPSQSGDVITDHRMIFRVTPQQTTLYDEIEYSGTPQSFAWVLPTHGPVSVGLSSDVVFAALDQVTQTQIVAPPPPTCPSCVCAEAEGPGSSSGGGFAGADAGAAGGVNVISQQTVGQYDTVQLQSTNPNALATWLTANGYAIPSSVQPVIAAYVNDGFDFLAMRLAPGQGVSAMRPVRVTSTGAGLSLPLRMVSAGTGATVGIALWVIGDGRYEPQNFSSFVISPSDLVWDWSTMQSNYTTLRAQKESAANDAIWQIESALQISPYQVEQPIMFSGGASAYLPIPASNDGGDDGGGSSGETAQQVMQDDLDTLFPGANQGTVWVTRMRADLSHAALATDLVLQASADQTPLSNIYQVTKSVNAPTCPAVPNPCPPCAGGGSSGGGHFGSGTGGLFGSSGGGTAGQGGGCSTTRTEESSSGNAIVLAALGAAALVLARGKRRR
jgi:MYXO-CTERM domain-containing protein